MDVEAPTTEAFAPLKTRAAGSGAQLGPAEKRGDKLVARMRLEAAK